MRVRIERSGGFANVRASAAADASTLAPNAADELRRRVRKLRFDPDTTPDGFQYNVTIEDDDGSAISARADAEELFQWMEELSQL